MKLKIDREDLLDGINIVSRAVTTRTTMPILECIHLSADGNGLRLMSNNLELGIRTSPIEAGVDIAGVVALDARLFSEIVKKLPDDLVNITVDKKFETTIKSGKSVFKIMGLDPTEFPALPDVERENMFSVNRNTLRDMIRQTIFAVSDNDAKPVFTGELIQVTDGMINIVAVDGFRVAHRYSKSDTAEQSFKVIVPGKTMNEIAKLLPGSEDSDIYTYFTGNHILFELDACTVTSRVISGEFINYKNTMQIDQSTVIRVNRIEFIMSLERASLIAIETGKKTPVKIKIENDMISITSNTERGTVNDELAVEMEGKDLMISFNPRLLIDALKAIEDSKVSIKFSGAAAPCIICPVDDGNYQYLVLPLRLDK